MGTKREFNWVLKENKLESEIKENLTKDLGFFLEGVKEGLRDYPEEPIILVDKEWNAFAVVKKIQKVEYSNKKTGYTFQLIRYLTDNEREMLTNLYKELYEETFK